MLIKEVEAFYLMAESPDGHLIIQKLTTNYPALMDKLGRFHSAINHAFNIKLDSPLYIEAIKDALLYVFPDFPTFKKIHKPLPRLPNFIKNKMFKLPPEEEVRMLGDTLSNESKYPPGGLKFFFNSDFDITLLQPVMEKFYKSVHSKNEVYLEDGQIVLNFTTFAAARRNFEFNYALTQNPDFY